jgi:hypothetical protein
MKILDITSITNSSQMPLKKGSLQFLQDSYREIVQAVMQALIGVGYDPNVVYVLYGCVNSSTAPVFNVSSGAVFYAGRVYFFNAASFTSAQAAVLSIVQTQYTTDADPVTFTDTAVRNIHNIFSMQVADGVSGSTIANFAQLFYLNFSIPQLLNLTAPTSGTGFTGNVVQLSGAYPNIKVFVPTPPTSVNPILYAGNYNIGDVVPGASDYAITFTTPLLTGAYYVLGTFISQGANAEVDTTCVFTVRSRTTTGFTLHAKEFASGVQNISFDFIVFAK